MLLESGELTERMIAANASYGLGSGAEEWVSLEQAMVLELFTEEMMENYFTDAHTASG